MTDNGGILPRRWWVALIVGGASAAAAYLYVGRPRLAGVALAVLMAWLLVLSVGPGWLARQPFIVFGLIVLLLTVQYGGLAHTIWLAIRAKDYRLRPFNRWWIYVAAIGLPLGVTAVLIQLPHGLGVYRMPAVSMEPALRVDDWFLVDLTAYGSAETGRGDLVVYQAPSGQSYVRRVVGLPGEIVASIDGVLSIDGVAVDREAVDRQPGEEPLQEGVREYRETLPDGLSYLVRDWPLGKGFVTRELPADTFFVMPDDRTRLRPDETVAREAIAGRVVSIAMSWDLSRIGMRMDR